MTERRCIFAWTDPRVDGLYPPYISINREEDGRITVHVRGPRREPKTEDNPNPFALAGREATITLPDEVLYDMGANLEAFEIVKRLEASKVI